MDEMTGNDWKCLEIAGYGWNGWRYLKITEICWNVWSKLEWLKTAYDDDDGYDIDDNDDDGDDDDDNNYDDGYDDDDVDGVDADDDYDDGDYDYDHDYHDDHDHQNQWDGLMTVLTDYCSSQTQALAPRVATLNGPRLNNLWVVSKKSILYINYGSFGHVKVIANPFSLKANAPTHFLQMVICKATDYSNLWFFSSISFKCHLQNKFHISDEEGVCFWRKKYFWKIWPKER